MRLLLLFYFIFGVYSIGFSQNKDFDFDDIENSEDSSPFVSDIPKIQFNFANISFGIRYLISGTNTSTNIKSFNIETIKTNEFSKTFKETIESSVIQKGNFNLDANYGIGAPKKNSKKTSSSLGIDVGLGMGIDYSVEMSNTVKTFNEFKSEDIAKYTNNVKDFQEEISKIEVKFDPYSGFINTSISIKNTGLTPIQVKNLSVKIIEFNSFTKQEESVLKILNLGDHTINPSDNQIATYGIPIRVDSLLTSEIIGILEKGNVLKAELQSYSLVYNKKDYVPSILNRQLKENTIRINVIDQYGNYNEYNVAYEIGNSKKITLEKALTLISKSETKITELKNEFGETVYSLQSFNGIKSDFDFWGTPINYSNSELNQAAWMIIINDEDNRLINLKNELPKGTNISVVYLKKRDIWKKIRKINTSSFIIGESSIAKNQSLWNFDFVFNNTEINPDILVNKLQIENGDASYKLDTFKIGKNDILELEIDAYKAKISSEERDFKYQPHCPAMCVGDWSLRFGKIKRIFVGDLMPITQKEISDNIFLKFPDIPKYFSLTELTKTGRGFFKVKDNGKLIFIFELSQDFISNDEKTIEIKLNHFEEKVEYGFFVNSVQSGHQIDYTNKALFIPRYVNINATIKKPLNE